MSILDLQKQRLTVCMTGIVILLMTGISRGKGFAYGTMDITQCLERDFITRVQLWLH